jgi:hypothetical protein
MPGDELHQALKAFLSIGVFIGGGGLVMLLIIAPGTPEYVLSLCSALIGAVIVVGVAIVYRVMN